MGCPKSSGVGGKKVKSENGVGRDHFPAPEDRKKKSKGDAKIQRGGKKVEAERAYVEAWCH